MRALARNWAYAAAALAIALAVHLASVAALPSLVMMRVFSALTREHGANTMTHGSLVTARSRAVVRPSPDLLYSTCPYDLDAAGGSLRVHASGMPRTYWSVSAFDARTNNFYVLDDRQAKGGFDFVLIGAHTSRIAGALPRIASPTTRGVVLVRTLIDDAGRLDEIDHARRHAGCEALR